MTRIGPTGVLVTDAEPHTPAWHEARAGGIGSSEIAAVLGIPGAYTSPFDLWWRKYTREITEPNAAMSWGTRLEPVIADAFAAAHWGFGGFHVHEAPGVIMHRERNWQRCSPDRLLIEFGEIRAAAEVGIAPQIAAILECKSDNNRAGWGEPGTDEIPAHYLAQVRWQLDTIGLTTAYVAVTFGGPPVEYVVEHDEDDAVLMREDARDFLDRLEAGTPPPIDSHTATTRRLKSLHPTVDGTEVQIEEGLYAARLDAHARVKSAEADRDLIDNEIRALMGAAQYALVNGERVISRSVFEVKEHVRRTSTTDRLNFSKPKRESAA